MRDRRVGRFIVTAEFMRDLRDGYGENMFRGLCVLDVKHDYMCNIAEYFAWHPSFAIVQEGEIIPLYRPVFTEDSATPVWIAEQP